MVSFGSSIRSFSCVFVRSPSFSFDYGRFRLLGGGRGFVRFVDSFVFVRFRPFSFVFVRLRTVSFVGGGVRGGGAWFRSVRRFVRFRAFSSVLLRFRLITAGFVRLMFQSETLLCLSFILLLRLCEKQRMAVFPLSTLVKELTNWDRLKTDRADYGFFKRECHSFHAMLLQREFTPRLSPIISWKGVLLSEHCVSCFR